MSGQWVDELEREFEQASWFLLTTHHFFQGEGVTSHGKSSRH